MITDENYFNKYCHNNWESKKLNYIYHFEVDTITISDDVINNFNKWECYEEMQRDIVKAQNNAPRHRRVESKDDNSC
jgi:hypothetical protein